MHSAVLDQNSHVVSLIIAQDRSFSHLYLCEIGVLPM